MFLKKVTLVTMSFCLCDAAFANDDWSYGIGTGFFALNIDGDLGVSTALGPSITNLDLSTGDLKDVLDSAFGFAGFAAKGKWKINYVMSTIKLTGSNSAEVTNDGFSYRSDLDFTSSGIDFNLEYKFTNKLSSYIGVRHTKHEIEFNYIGDNVTIDRDIENDWTDIYIGLAYSMPINESSFWHTNVDFGGGDSERSTTFNTGVTWLFKESWASTIYAKHYSVEFENNEIGDPEWYLYDSSEFGAGIGITYLW